MTQREFFTAIVNSDLNEELTTFASEAISKLDARNAKRASKPSKKSIENVPIRAHIVGFLEENEGSHLASEIAKAVDISTQKASALCRQMVLEEVLTSTDVKVKGKGSQKSYSLA